MDILMLKTDGISREKIFGFLDCLDGARRKSVLKKTDDDDKINALLSRLLLLSELEKRAKIPRRRISFAFGTYGKPYLKGSNLQFSMSHTHGAIVAAFSEDGEVGVDVERKSRPVRPRLFDKALSENERKIAETSVDFIGFWVKKEAFLKRLGVGITRDLKKIDTESIPDTAAIDAGDFIVGVSGRNAHEAVILEIALDNLLSEYEKPAEK